MMVIEPGKNPTRFGLLLGNRLNVSVNAQIRHTVFVFLVLIVTPIDLRSCYFESKESPRLDILLRIQFLGRDNLTVPTHPLLPVLKFREVNSHQPYVRWRKIIIFIWFPVVRPNLSPVFLTLPPQVKTFFSPHVWLTYGLYLRGNKTNKSLVPPSPSFSRAIFVVKLRVRLTLR